MNMWHRTCSNDAQKIPNGTKVWVWQDHPLLQSLVIILFDIAHHDGLELLVCQILHRPQNSNIERVHINNTKRKRNNVNIVTFFISSKFMAVAPVAACCWKFAMICSRFCRKKLGISNWMIDWVWTHPIIEIPTFYFCVPGIGLQHHRTVPMSLTWPSSIDLLTREFRDVVVPGRVLRVGLQCFRQLF